MSDTDARMSEDDVARRVATDPLFGALGLLDAVSDFAQREMQPDARERMFAALRLLRDNAEAQARGDLVPRTEVTRLTADLARVLALGDALHKRASMVGGASEHDLNDWRKGTEGLR